MQILINGLPAILKSGSSFEYVSENRLFTGSDSYTLNMTFPLADCPQNRAIFGNITRKDVVKEAVVFDCSIQQGALYRSGVVTITEVTERDVKVQFLEGRSAQNFRKTFDKVYINEFEWGHYPGGLARNYAPASVWELENGVPEFVALPWVNSYSGNIQNEARYDSTHGNYAWVYRNGNPQSRMRLSFQPFLIYAVKEILTEMGYTYDFREWEVSYHRFLLICNTLPGAWDLCSYARAMPHWSITEFLQQIELLLNCEFDIDHKAKKVGFRYTANVVEEVQEEVIEVLIDEYKVDISSEENEKFLPAHRRQYAECSHRVWRYYSCPWLIRALKGRVQTFQTMAQFLSACRNVASVNMDSIDEQLAGMINGVYYVVAMDTYFVFRNTSAVKRNGSVVRTYAPVPVNVFGDRRMTGAEDEKVEELKMVPAWMDETDEEHGFMLFLEMNNYDEEDGDGVEEGASLEKVDPAPLAMLAQGEQQGVKEYYDKVYLAYWNGVLPQNEVPRPWVDRIMIDSSWRYQEYPSSLRFDSVLAMPLPEHDVDLRQKYSFSFLSNRIPNPRAVFHINGFRYVCEKISATLTENGVSRKMNGTFYRLIGVDE